MKKSIKLAMAIVFLITLSTATHIYATKDEGTNINVISISDATVSSDNNEMSSMKNMVERILDDNVKKHRDSGLYKMILVNDKIIGKYQSMSYRLNKELRYNSTLDEMRSSQQE